MAHVVKRTQKKSGVTTYQVRWRQGGGRDGKDQSERFDDETQAERFKDLVNAHGQAWPHGWVPGEGFVEPEAEKQGPGDMPLTEWAHRYIDRLTGIEEWTRHDYRRMVDRDLVHITHERWDGRVVPATIGNVVQDDVRTWVRLQEGGRPDPTAPGRWLVSPASAKTIANRFGLLSSVVQAAVDARPPLRDSNCCHRVRLPRPDQRTAEEMVFLEHDEYQRLRLEFADPNARDLADWLVGTGMRWGEATAVQPRDLDFKRGTVSVQRAWKRLPNGGGYVLGPPKTRRGRRTLALSGEQMDMLRRRTVGLHPEALVFGTARGLRWGHSNFHKRRWLPAVTSAVAKGLRRRPRIHDLRHTHVSWLIAANIPVPAIQARVGHESIKTTVDRYGHLLRQMDSEITTAVSEAMTPTLPAVSSPRVVAMR